MVRAEPVRVLVLEDNPADAHVARTALEAGEFRTTVVGRVRDAVPRLAEADLALIDLGLPDSDGLKTLDRVREAAPGVPVVVLSGRRDDETAFQCLQHGAVDVLVKGRVDPEELVRAVRCALERRALQDERDEAVRRADAKERDLRDVILASREGMLVTDRADRVLFANPAAADLLGAGSEGLVGSRISLPRGGAAPTEIERRGPDGEPRAIELAVSRIHWEGRPALLATLHDLTPRRRAERAMREREEKRHEAELMDAVGRLSGGIAGVLNNQLTVILGYAALLREEPDPEGRIPSRARRIEEAAQRSVALVDQLLACAFRRMSVPVVLDPGDVVDGIRDRLQRLLREDVHFDVDTSARPGRVRADRRLLELATTILVEHARDSMAGGGEIRVRTVAVRPRPERGAREPRPPRMAIEVTDTGPGYDADARLRLFEPFFTSQVLGIGSGLGLAPVYGIARQSGGEVEVRSSLGRGATLRVILPVVEAAPGSTEPPRETKAREIDRDDGGTPRGRETVLVAEGDPAVRSLVATFLEELGYSVLTASSAGEAVRRFSSRPEAVQLLLADAEVPGMSGKGLAEMLRRVRPGIRVLLTSKSPSAPDSEMGEPLLRKPFGREDLGRRIREVLDTPLPARDSPLPARSTPA
jgi:signal transduction histidine kinase